jgi:hypothetical protein
VVLELMAWGWTSSGLLFRPPRPPGRRAAAHTEQGGLRAATSGAASQTTREKGPAETNDRPLREIAPPWAPMPPGASTAPCWTSSLPRETSACMCLLPGARSARPSATPTRSVARRFIYRPAARHRHPSRNTSCP